MQSFHSLDEQSPLQFKGQDIQLLVSIALIYIRVDAIFDVILVCTFAVKIGLREYPLECLDDVLWNNADLILMHEGAPLFTQVITVSTDVAIHFTTWNLLFSW